MRASAGTSLLLACLVGCGYDATLRSGLSEREAGRIVVALDRAAIAAARQPEAGARDRYLVAVATRDVTHALRVLDRQRLTTPPAPGFDELYRDPSLVSTPEEEAARRLAATAGELARSLERLPGVVAARVHLAAPRAPAQLDAPASGPTAAVLVERRHAARPLDESAVRRLIAAAVAGIAATDIAIIQTEAEADRADAQPRFAYLGPIAVARESALLLRVLLGTLFALDLLLGALLFVLVRRLRQQRAERDA